MCKQRIGFKDIVQRFKSKFKVAFFKIDGVTFDKSNFLNHWLIIVFNDILGPVHMILLAEMSRLAGRIFPCVHMRFFIPLNLPRRNSIISACEICISVTQHNYLTILAFFFIYLQEKALLLCSKLFKSIVDDENHKLHKLLPMNVPDIYNFRIPKQFYIPKFRTNRTLL